MASPAAARDLLRRAVAHHEAGRLREAEAAYRQILQQQPGHPHALHLLGVALYQSGRSAAALPLIEEATRAMPDNPAYHSNLGRVYQSLGSFPEAIAAQERALRCKADHLQAWTGLGETWAEAGNQEQAIAAYERVLALSPNHPEALNGLGIALKAVGRRTDAIDAYRRAIAARPGYAEALANLGLALYDTADLKPAIEALSEAVRHQPDLGMAQLYLGIFHEQQGDASAEAHFAAARAALPAFSALKDGWDHAKTQSDPETHFLGSVFDVLDLALGAATVDGLVLEFGVRFGTSIRHLARHAGREVHGFDSFEGLPEAWGDKPSGVYTTGGMLPEVPANVRLHAGWFADTLPTFAASYPGPIRLMNIDCDIYSSTKTIFDVLSARIVAGSILIFDEYFMTARWREDEYKAFQEAVARNGWRYRYLAFGPVTRQAVVQILETPDRGILEKKQNVSK